MANNPTHIYIDASGRSDNDVIRELKKKEGFVLKALKQRRYYLTKGQKKRLRHKAAVKRSRRESEHDGPDFKPFPIPIDHLLKKEKTEGVMIILIAPTVTGPKLVIIQDLDRYHPGFAYGAVEKTDSSIYAAGRREALEELFGGSDIKIRFSPKHKLGILRSGLHIIHILCARLSPNIYRQLRKGNEQKWLKTETPDQVGDRIARGRFSNNHANAFRLLEAKWPHLLK